jgi:superfamily I DNA and/or RNA helicase
MESVLSEAVESHLPRLLLSWHYRSQHESLIAFSYQRVNEDELAFSPDLQTGKLPLNFGPLLQVGGEKRLNVAVTRARAQVIVFSSFYPAHIANNHQLSPQVDP